jgi:hypothetical protein
MGVLKPDLIMKSVIPVVMAGILGIYGMIVAVILQGKGTPSFLYPPSLIRHRREARLRLPGWWFMLWTELTRIIF